MNRIRIFEGGQEMCPNQRESQLSHLSGFHCTSLFCSFISYSWPQNKLVIGWLFAQLTINRPSDNLCSEVTRPN